MAEDQTYKSLWFMKKIKSDEKNSNKKFNKLN